MELFADEVFEVVQDGVRYVLRRNPLRAEQLAASRADKQASVERLVEERNRYLRKHGRAPRSRRRSSVCEPRSRN